MWHYELCVVVFKNFLMFKEDNSKMSFIRLSFMFDLGDVLFFVVQWKKPQQSYFRKHSEI